MGDFKTPYFAAMAGHRAAVDPDPMSPISVSLNAYSAAVVQGTPEVYRMMRFREAIEEHQRAEQVSSIRSGWTTRLRPTKSACRLGRRIGRDTTNLAYYACVRRPDMRRD